MDVELELHSYARSNQVDFHLSLFLCMNFKHSQADAEIEVAEENDKEKLSREAETEVRKCQTHVLSFFHALSSTNDTFFRRDASNVQHSDIQSAKTAESVVQSKMNLKWICEIGDNNARYSATSSKHQNSGSTCI